MWRVNDPIKLIRKISNSLEDLAFDLENSAATASSLIFYARNPLSSRGQLMLAAATVLQGL